MADLHSDIEKYQSDPLFAYLDKRIVTLPGKPPHVPQRTILVMESCGLISFRQGRITAELRLRPQDESSSVLEKLYLSAASCSFGDVPTPGEFLALPHKDIDIWIQDARQVNPEMFEWLTAAEKVVEKLNEEQLKKRKEAAQVRSWLEKLFLKGTSDGLSQFLDFSYDNFLKYKDDWILWRNLGHVDNNGTWIAPVSFIEAQQLPTQMLQTFFSLDNQVAKMAKQQTKKGKRK